MKPTPLLTLRLFLSTKRIYEKSKAKDQAIKKRSI